MLLPSSASNPANMMAQALTMYKSLVGNVPGNATHEAAVGAIEYGDADGSSKEAEDESTYTMQTAKPFHHEEPRFSLQSPEKVE